MNLHVYLSGEIHSEWRREIMDACTADDLPITFLLPITEHALSDSIGTQALGEEADAFWADHKSAKINAIRIRTMIDKADVVVVKFGEEYRQWNAAFDAGYAFASGKSLITLHPPDLTHALKEVDAAALAVADSPQQVKAILAHIVSQQDG